MNASKASHAEAMDPQVQQIHDDAKLPSLLDVVSEKMLGSHRDPRRPTISRLVLIGEINRGSAPRFSRGGSKRSREARERSRSDWRKR